MKNITPKPISENVNIFITQSPNNHLFTILPLWVGVNMSQLYKPNRKVVSSFKYH